MRTLTAYIKKYPLAAYFILAYDTTSLYAITAVIIVLLTGKNLGRKRIVLIQADLQNMAAFV